MVRLLGREVAGEGEGDPRRSEASGLEAEPLQVGAELRGVQEQQGLEEVQQRQQGAWYMHMHGICMVYAWYMHMHGACTVCVWKRCSSGSGVPGSGLGLGLGLESGLGLGSGCVEPHMLASR